MISVHYCIGLCNHDSTFMLNTKPALSVPTQINLIHWEPIILNMLQNAFFFDNIERGSVLLVNIIKNNTNGIFQTNNVTNILIKCIVENTGKYNVIDIERLHSVYRELGVFPEDNRNSYNFSIKIANYLQANYILYGIAYGNSEKPNLELQLISVKTGEILRVVSGSA
ncbi:penicillin-binding protein activator LpoB [Candidatus Blochmannia vicinus (nom. nud.)]|uniref:penicillin-binding protein activator LpoB n=1 Tax=Candidatus Blochmannia vicinus (nom. nud.) TaxID=251540 RepID=UPI0020254EEF|nr:penicillin-binding protein activator LpoB [Candidatus Blochmannia vicinus]URJ30364.1 penicillin-binding protein activator LpoB [Candidatus Blochmannia vicinus]